jgi:hypothetical protein
VKLRTLLPAILLLPLLTPGSYAQTPPELQGVQNSGILIELERFYPGTIVLELVKAAEEEIETAVNEAYAEGYKAAMLRYAPAYEVLKITAETLRTELQTERRKNRFFMPAAGLSFAGGFLLCSWISR